MIKTFFGRLYMTTLVVGEILLFFGMAFATAIVAANVICKLVNLW